MDTPSSASAHTSPSCQRFDASALPTVGHNGRLPHEKRNGAEVRGCDRDEVRRGRQGITGSGS